MRTGSATIALLLANDAFVSTDLVTITPIGMTPILLTSLDQNLVNAGTFLTCGGRSGRAGLRRGTISWGIGTAVNTMTLTADTSADNPGFASGQDFARLAAAGRLHGAAVLYQRVHALTFAGLATSEKVWIFSGTVSDITVTDGQVEMTIKSDLHKLQTTLPKRCFSPGCAYPFCGAACGKSAVTYTDNTRTCNSAQSNVGIIGCSGANFILNEYAGGTLTVTSGLLDGMTRGIIANDDNSNRQCALDVPLPSLLAHGDALSIMKGCAKTLAACTAYGNQTKFPGAPLVPTRVTQGSNLSGR